MPSVRWPRVLACASLIPLSGACLGVLWDQEAAPAGRARGDRRQGQAVAAFGQDHDGEVYVVTHEGPIYKLARR